MKKGALAVFLWVCASPALADTARLAIVVGNDTGSGDRPALRYAEDDAAKFARVMTELGGVPADDMYLLRGRPSFAIDDAFQRVSSRIAEIHKHAGRALLIFYFSGHSNGESMQIGKERFSFSDMRHRLTASGADVRLAIVDSCMSGALLTAKSGTRQPPFEIRLADDLPTKGVVLLSSSAADENALESSEIRGSFFTHNLVSGLRGAADSSGDGRVTLAEAYRYAYARTVAATALTSEGTQHPAYDMQLSGTGELVLTELNRPSGALLLPVGFERALVAEPWRDEILAEVPAGAPRRLAVPPGDYVVRLWRANRVYAGRVLVQLGRTQQVAWADLQPAPLVADATATKGGGSTDLDTADLSRAISDFENLQDERAAPLLQNLLLRQPGPLIEAKAHLYLALIALNLVRPQQARTEIKLALRANPMLEVPAAVASSPKVQLAFAEARSELQREIAAEPSAPQRPSALVLSAPEAPAPTATALSASSVEPASRRYHALGWTLAGVGAVAAGVAIYGAIQVVNFNSSIASGKPGSIASQTLVSNQSAANFWAKAWLPFAIGSALAGAGAVVTW